MAQQYTIYSGKFSCHFMSLDMFLMLMHMTSLFQDDDVDVGASSDEDISDNEFSTKKSSSVGSKKKKPGFAFDFDNGDVSDRILKGNSHPIIVLICYSESI
jgi:hypothetical protein